MTLISAVSNLHYIDVCLMGHKFNMNFMNFVSFLLDRLLKYEKLDDTSDDSDVTASSDSEAEVHKEPVMKRFVSTDFFT